MAEPAARDFGDVDEIDVEAIGEPGHRTFRLLAEREGATASIWVEKEQLQALAMVVEQQVARMSESRGGTPPLLTLAARFPSRATIDFKVGRMAVGFDEQQRKFVIRAHELEQEAGDAALTLSATREQIQGLTEKIVQVVAAGRPRCPLCGAPIEGKHVCPASNGHVG
jgi:uncharacterized repeat protein (TIGR03847 family)